MCAHLDDLNNSYNIERWKAWQRQKEKETNAYRCDPREIFITFNAHLVFPFNRRVNNDTSLEQNRLKCFDLAFERRISGVKFRWLNPTTIVRTTEGIGPIETESKGRAAESSVKQPPTISSEPRAADCILTRIDI